ncbi:P-loop containing nucleoside triphosphate hydrolase protein [Aspergillus fruticulosus]
MLFCIRQALKFALDLIITPFVVALIALITSFKDRFSAGGIGVALNLVIAFSSTLNTAIEAWTQMEISLGAVSRVQRFVEEVPREETRGVDLDDGWPTSQGAEVVFENVVAGYRQKAILANLNLHIRAGQKLAICGASGRIAIDGTDLSAIKPATLRSLVAVVPQDPFFIPSTTLRFNLNPDPTPRHGAPVHDSDEHMVSTLRKVGLWDKLRPLGGLDALMDATELSYGEKQLLALARALVADRPLLILDEAMSAVDWETEVRMLEIIKHECTAKTVVAVMHRLRHVEWLDRVAVIQDGRLVEFDAP